MVKKSISAIILLMTVLIVLSVGIAGCTSQTPAASPTPATTTTVSVTGPSEMVVKASEIPGNFTLVDQRERTASELSDWALEHGWIKGYSVTYRKDDGSSSGTIIRQNISIYTGENATLAVSDTIDGLADWIVTENNATMSVEKISIPAIGDASGSLKYSDKSDNSTMYVVAFAKNGIFQDIETNGTAADYETARQFAEIAAAKIK